MLIKFITQLSGIAHNCKQSWQSWLGETILTKYSGIVQELIEYITDIEHLFAIYTVTYNTK